MAKDQSSYQATAVIIGRNEIVSDLGNTLIKYLDVITDLRVRCQIGADRIEALEAELEALKAPSAANGD